MRYRAGVAPRLRVLTRYSAALRLPPSLPLMSPFGLPSAGYPASARWHVFAPAQLIRRISRPAAPPSELPCGSLSSTFPKGLDSPFGLPLAVYLDLSQRSRLSKKLCLLAGALTC
jgi:hypothetical protein